MLTRRLFLLSLIAFASSLSAFSQDPLAARSSSATEKHSFKGREIFDSILARAASGNWRELPIGQLMAKIAEALEGTPYVANTLELSPDVELCSVNMTGLDCVTFFETTLAFARMIKKGGHEPEDLLREINYTRYRGGILGDYSSRLHYTSDWLVDNEKKGVVHLLNELPGVEPFVPNVSVMSEHPKNSIQLAAHPDLVIKIKGQEKSIGKYLLHYVPVNKIAAAEPSLRSGDIVGLCLNKNGIDITHTGLVYCDEGGVRHFMDASSKKSSMKVTIEPGPISELPNWSRGLIGAIFARPLEPKNHCF